MQTAREEKWSCLLSALRDIRLAVVAFSGGVDSSLLLAAAAEAMGPNVIAVTAVSGTYPPGEIEIACESARLIGVQHRILATDELANENFTGNPPDRCYFCKQELFAKLRRIADQEGIPCVLDGTNVDDLADHRPGRQAAAEAGVRSPLAEAGLTKVEVRELARGLNIPVWDKPSLACLSSRIPYGTRITPDILRTVHESEKALHAAGFRQVRVRHHGDTARIELERGDFAKLVGNGLLDGVTRSLKELGFTYVTLDLEGYRTGSMNKSLKSLKSS